MKTYNLNIFGFWKKIWAMFWPWKNCTYRENAFWPPCEETAHRMAHKKKSYIKIVNFQVHVVLLILYLPYAYLFIGVAWGTASKWVLLGTGATVVGFATFGFKKLSSDTKYLHRGTPHIKSINLVNSPLRSLIINLYTVVSFFRVEPDPTARERYPCENGGN